MNIYNKPLPDNPEHSETHFLNFASVNPDALAKQFLITHGFLVAHADGSVQKAPPKPAPPPPANPIAIHEAQDRLQRAQAKNNQLSALKNVVDISVDETDWERQCVAMKFLQDEISEALQPLQDPVQMQRLSKLIKKRQAKRRRLKRRRERIAVEYDLSLQKRKELHVRIDAWQALQRETMAAEKAHVDKIADLKTLLKDLTRRIVETKRYILLFEELKALRRPKFKSCVGNADGQSEFNATMDELKRVWCAVLDEYNREEVDLRASLSLKLKSNLCESTVIDEWRQVLFGKSSQRMRSSLHRADRDFDYLVNVRRAWDQCLVDDPLCGSSIPPGWILPPEKPSRDWALYQIAK